MEILVVVLILALIGDMYNGYRQHGWEYPFLTHAGYLMVAIVGIVFFLLVPFKPTLSQELIDQITIAGLGFALATVGYTIMVQTHTNWEQSEAQTKILSDLQKIKNALNISTEE